MAFLRFHQAAAPDDRIVIVVERHTETIIRAARAGGNVLRMYFGQSLETTQKSHASDFRTKADLESERVILDILTAEYPSYNILSEEFGEIKNGSEYTFVVDPLDGTNNFVLGIPNFSVSIGLMCEGKSIAGVIYVPVVDHVYYAEIGGGAFQDGKRLSVSTETSLPKSTIANCNGYATYVENEIGLTKVLYRKDVKRITVNWCLTFDMCLLSAGRTEGMIVDGLSLHDFAAGKVIAREAGAIITGLDGTPTTDDCDASFLVGCNAEVHRELVKSVYEACHDTGSR